MVTSVLNNASSGLRLTQTLLGVTSRNIVNASTEGYTRKTQEGVTGPGGGALAGPVRRATDELLTKQLRADTSARSAAQTLSSALDRIDRLAGDPTRTDSISGRLSALADGLQRLITDPITPIGYQDVIAEAEALAATFRTTYVELEGVAREALQAIPEEIAEVNHLAESIAAVNRQVTAGASLGRDTTDLLDQRDRMLGRMSELIEVRTVLAQRNVLQIYTADSKLIANEGSFALTAAVDGTIYAGNLPIERVGGSVGARQEIANRMVPGFMRQLDDLAARLTAGLETAGTTDVPPLPGLPLFNDSGILAFDPLDPAQLEGYASRIRVNDAVASDPLRLRGLAGTPVGDTSLLVRARQVILSDAHDFTAAGLPTRATLTLAASTFVGNVASGTASARDNVEARQVAEDMVRTRLAQISDVNVDEEMARMVQLQMAYAANARVITAVQSMMDELLNAVR